MNSNQHTPRQGFEPTILRILVYIIFQLRDGRQENWIETDERHVTENFSAFFAKKFLRMASIPFPTPPTLRYLKLTISI
jgi:hypothetical protein